MAIGRQSTATRGAAFAAVVLLAAALEPALRSWGGRGSIGPAVLIWSGEGRRERGPTAFWAADDFALDRAPEQARLTIQADPEYVLWLNGRRVGAGGLDGARTLDRYEVARLLRPGVNRILVELRSGHGVGALFVHLVGEPDGRTLAASGPSFSIHRRDDPELLRGLRPLDDRGSAFVWGRPPMGRWRTHGTIDRPLDTSASTAGDRAVEPIRRETSGRESRLIWDPPATGRLELTLAKSDGVQVALIDFEPGTGASTPVIVMPNRDTWLDVHTRRIRGVRFVGVPAILGARVVPATTPAASEAAAAANGQGIFGIEPPPLRTPVEDEVRRQLEGLPRF